MITVNGSFLVKVGKVIGALQKIKHQWTKHLHAEGGVDIGTGQHRPFPSTNKLLHQGMIVLLNKHLHFTLEFVKGVTATVFINPDGGVPTVVFDDHWKTQMTTLPCETLVILQQHKVRYVYPTRPDE